MAVLYKHQYCAHGAERRKMSRLVKMNLSNVLGLTVWHQLANTHQAVLLVLVLTLPYSLLITHTK
jgi:hypothetical protein